MAVLCVDLDCYFVQVEQLRHPHLRGKPVCIQQHQDIIAANAEAKAAGVRKHMAPAEARAVLRPVGGVVWHVHTEEGGRVSYQPYREVSARFMSLLKSLPCAAVVEAASIDEAYVQLVGGKVGVALRAAEPPGARQAPAMGLAPGDAALPQNPPHGDAAWEAGGSSSSSSDSGGNNSGGGGGSNGAEAVSGGVGRGCLSEGEMVATGAASTAWVKDEVAAGAGSAAMAAGAASAAWVKAEVLKQLGLVASVGVAPNKLLAKMASLAAKPDGIQVVHRPEEVAQLLGSTAVSRLPGCGGRLQQALEAAGIRCVADLQGWTPQALRERVGARPDLALQLAQWAHGRCTSRVEERGPPRSLSTRMSLTPVRLPQHPAQRGASVSGGGRPGYLEPLRLGAEDYVPRMRALLGSMAADLVGRVYEDRNEHGRWPRTQSLQLTLTLPHQQQQQHRVASKSCAFPSHTLGNAAEVEAAYLANALRLATSMCPSSYGGHHHPLAAAAAAVPLVTQVQLEASAFAPASAAGRAITHFFQPKQQRQQQQHGEAAVAGAQPAGTGEASTAQAAAAAKAAATTEAAAAAAPAAAAKASTTIEAAAAMAAPPGPAAKAATTIEAATTAATTGAAPAAAATWPASTAPLPPPGRRSSSVSGSDGHDADGDSCWSGLQWNAGPSLAAAGVGPGRPGAEATALAAAGGVEQQRRQGQQLLKAGVPDPLADVAAPPAGVADPLAGVDVAEQERILRDIIHRRQEQQQHVSVGTAAGAGKAKRGAAVSTSGTRLGTTAKRGKAVADGGRGGTRQLSITSMFASQPRPTPK